MKRRRICIFLLLAALVLQLSVCAVAASQTSTIRQLLNYYRYHQEDAQTDIHRLLLKMEESDEEQAALWRSIMDNWSWVNTQMEITPDCLPEGLPEDESLCIVVMGYKLKYNGTMNTELVRRLEVALASAQKYPNAKILVTGGTSAAGNKQVSEATRMKNWLVEMGIPESRIIRENVAYSTETNAIYVLRKLKAEYPEVKHLALITSDYHMPRVWLFFSTVQLLSQDGLIDIAANAAYMTGISRESIGEQAMGMAELAGVNIDRMNWPGLSRVTELAILGNTEYRDGDSLHFSATAHYDTGVSRDVTAKVTFTGFDPYTPGTQTVTFYYKENGHNVTASTNIQVEPPETTAPPTTQATTPPAQTEAAKEIPEPAEGNTPHISWLLIPIFILILLCWQLYRQLQKKKRRRRRRKKMFLE